MSFVISEAERDAGVVYLDATRRELASTHALVIGVGQYASDRLSPLSSPPLAARMLAEWFLDGMDETRPGGFFNAEKPLGSLSVLLSEPPKDTHSRFADSDVPRATFDNVKKAVEAWIERAGSHPDNFLFLFVSSHGESFGRRTAFLLEDYGTKKTDVTAGMSEIEQFVEALANIDAKQQLLIFDCCRTPTSLGLRFDQEFGTRLINLPAATAERIRRAHVLRSTGLGFEAWGRKDGPTVFAQVLLDALRGLAASSDDWTVDNFGLARTVARLLDLHERNGEPLQMADNQLNAPFVVSTVPETDTATVFISLGPKHDFSTCSIRMDDQLIERANPDTARFAPFARLVLPKYQARKIAALDATGQLIGEARIEPVPPVAFKEFPEQFKVRHAPAKKSATAGSGLGQIALSLTAATASPSSGFIAVIRPRGTRADAAPMTIALAPDGEISLLSVKPGRYDVSLDISDGRTLFSAVSVRADLTTEIVLELPAPQVDPNPPPREGEALAVDDPVHGPAAKTDPKTWLTRLGISEARIQAGEWPGADIFAVPISPALSRQLAGLESYPGGGALDPEPVMLVPKSPGVFGVRDSIARRLPQRLEPQAAPRQQADQPVWVAAVGDRWREIAAIPSLGVQGKFQNDSGGKRDSWMPALVVDPMPRAAASHLRAVIDTRQWGGLLTFLARRDFELSGAVLDDLVGPDSSHSDIRNALIQKVENPMAAAAAALVAVATRRLAALKIPEAWLRNLINWFPLLPDGPVILARHLMSQGNAGAADVKALLLEACHRGVPVFSLSVDWLAQGLAAFADDPDVAVRARSIRRTARLCDPTRTFTVLRIPVEEDAAS
jgi:hypothetical protein